jgi:hypothetical protein
MARSSEELINQLKLELDRFKRQTEESTTLEVVVGGAIVVRFPDRDSPGRVSINDTNRVEALSKMENEGGIPIGFAY